MLLDLHVQFVKTSAVSRPVRPVTVVTQQRLQSVSVTLTPRHHCRLFTVSPPPCTSSSSSAPPRLNCRLLSLSGSCDAMSLKSLKMSWNVSSSPVKVQQVQTQPAAAFLSQMIQKENEY